MNDEVVANPVIQSLSKAWKLVNEEFRSVFHILVLFFIPLNVIIGFVPEVGNMTEMPLSFALWVITGMILNVLAVLSLIHFTFQKEKQKPVAIESSMRFALERFMPVFATNLMVAAGTIVGFALLIIPGIMFLVYTIFITQIMVAKQKYFLDAIRTGIEFTKGRWWEIFGWILLQMIIIYVSAALILLLFHGLPDTAFNRIAQNTIMDAFAIFYVISISHLYLELDRKTGKR